MILALVVVMIVMHVVGFAISLLAHIDGDEV